SLSFPSLSYAMPERTETGSAPFLREQPRSSEDLIARELGSNEDGRRVLERAGRDFLLLDELRPVDELRVELDALFHRVPHDEGRNAYLLAGVDDRVFLRAVFPVLSVRLHGCRDESLAVAHLQFGRDDHRRRIVALNDLRDTVHELGTDGDLKRRSLLKRRRLLLCLRSLATQLVQRHLLSHFCQ